MHYYNPEKMEQQQVRPEYSPLDQAQQYLARSPQLENDREQNLSSIFEIDNQPIVQEIIGFLSGRKKDHKGKLVPIDKLDHERYRLVNDKGISDIITLLRPLTDKMIILSDLTIDEIYSVCRDTRITLIRLLAENYKRYDLVPDKANLKLILTVIDNSVFVTAKRSHRGGEKKHRETMMRMIESITQREQKPPGSGISLSPFKMFSKNRSRIGE